MAIIYPPNPNPVRISGAIWQLWNDFDRHEPSALLGGVYAAKPGYHNYRNALGFNDYSVGDLAADRKGSGAKASALDISMGESLMRKYTTRLDVAARKRDPRLYTAAGPILREFIGTKDGDTVYCYVLTGGKQLGIKSDAGSDPGRSETHLWHIHLSIIRQFCEDYLAMAGLFSVLVGQPIEEWDNDMNGSQDQKLTATTERMAAQALGKDTITTTWASDEKGQEPQWQVRAIKALGTAVADIAKALPQVDDAVAAQLRGTLEGLKQDIAATPSQVVAQLTAVGNDAGADALIAALGEEEARAFAQKVLDKTAQ